MVHYQRYDVIMSLTIVADSPIQVQAEVSSFEVGDEPAHFPQLMQRLQDADMCLAFHCSCSTALET